MVGNFRQSARGKFVVPTLAPEKTRKGGAPGVDLGVLAPGYVNHGFALVGPSSSDCFNSAPMAGNSRQSAREKFVVPTLAPEKTRKDGAPAQLSGLGGIESLCSFRLAGYPGAKIPIQ